MSGDNEYSIDFDEVVNETDGAYLFKVGDVSCWLPKSEIRVYHKSKKFFAPEWLLLDKGLI